MPKRLFCLLLCFAITLLCGCSKEEANNTASYEQTDYPASAFDVSVKKCPQKVISLSPVVTDIIIALGSDAQLIGISDNCVEHRELPRFGTSVQPDIDAIKEQKPDLVFMSESADDADALLLDNAGILVARVRMPNKYIDLANTYNDIAVLMSGNITGVRNASNTFTTIDSQIKKAANSNQNKVKAAVFVNQTVTVTKGSIAAELMNFAGVETLLTSSDDKIIESGAQLILCPVGMKEEFESRFTDIKVAEFDMSLFDRRGAQMAQIVTEIIAIIEQ